MAAEEPNLPPFIEPIEERTEGARTGDALRCKGEEMKGARILLVDDEVEFTDSMSKLLIRRGYQVTTVDSGLSAITALSQNHYDLMILDLKMPGMDGIATLKKIKDLQLLTHTLILTGHGAIGTALEAMRLGAYGYLTKPCEVDELIKKIEAAWAKDGTLKREPSWEET